MLLLSHMLPDSAKAQSYLSPDYYTHQSTSSHTNTASQPAHTTYTMLQHPFTHHMLRWPQHIPPHYVPMHPYEFSYNTRSNTPDFLMQSMAPTQYNHPSPPSDFYSSPVASPMAHCEPQAPYVPYPSPTQVLARPVPFAAPYNRTKKEQQSRPTGRITKSSPQPKEPFKGKIERAIAAAPPSLIPIAAESLTSKIITANQMQNPVERIEFNTTIDQLMMIIQHDNVPTKEENHMLTPAASPKSEPVSPPSFKLRPSTPAKAGRRTGSRTDSKQPKEFKCDGPGCNKVFTQKTHLNVHYRTHTGERPYGCSFDGCDRAFSQPGNLRTHMKRHTGVKPFKCSHCDKRFVHKSSVRSHEQTHDGKKPFQCILDGCDTKFSQRGNMKAHQNNFHRDTLEELTAMFTKFVEEGCVPTEYRKLFEYFKIHYKNSNKGIKGRGKACKIASREDKPKPVLATRRRQNRPIVPVAVMHTHSPGGMENTMGLGPVCVPGSLSTGSYDGPM